MSRLIYTDHAVKVYHRPELDYLIRRLIKNKKIKFTKPNGKDYQFKKSDLILFKKAG